MCGTGTLASDLGAPCQQDSDCKSSTEACDLNTPNALDSYCTQPCKSIADCPCSGGTWTCALNPKFGAVTKYCTNTAVGG